MFVKNKLGFLFKVSVCAYSNRYNLIKLMDMFQYNDSNHLNQNASVGYASGDEIAAFISFLSTILATLLLVGAILVLYKVANNDLRLGLIALFTVVFAASVGLLTKASMAEVFGATAASVIPFWHPNSH